jgi:dihydrofolate reductase
MKLTTTTMISLDGVMQGLGGPEEDRRGNFERGGWSAPLFDEEAGADLGRIYARADAFLFGRWTYDLFAGYWGKLPNVTSGNPVAFAMNTKPKYVVSNSSKEAGWADTRVLSGDIAAAIRDLKAQPGGELQVHGSGKLVRWLLENNLVDEMNLHTYPLVLGQGARLFPETGPDRAFELAESRSTPSGVIIQVYRVAGRPDYRLAEPTLTEVHGQRGAAQFPE